MKDLIYLKLQLEKSDSSVPLRTKIYQILKKGILEGFFEQQEEITENYIADAFAVSRTPVREAMQRLETEGWLKRTHGKGAVITKISGNDLRDLYLMRSVLEGLAVSLVIPKISQQALEQLQWIIEEMELHTKKKSPKAVASKNKEFHWLIVQLSNSRHLKSTLKSVYEQIDRVRESSLSAPGRIEEALKEHQAIYKSIKNGNGQKAAKLVREHVLKACEAILKRIGIVNGNSKN